MDSERFKREFLRSKWNMCLCTRNSYDSSDVFCSRIPFSTDMSIKLIRFFISAIMMEINRVAMVVLKQRWEIENKTHNDWNVETRKTKKKENKHQTESTRSRLAIEMGWQGQNGKQAAAGCCRQWARFIFIFSKTNICCVFSLGFFFIGWFSLCSISRFPFDDYRHPAARCSRCGFIRNSLCFSLSFFFYNSNISLCRWWAGAREKARERDIDAKVEK